MEAKKTRAEAGRLGWLKVHHIFEERKKKFREDYNANPKHCIHCGAPIAFEKRRNKCCDNPKCSGYNRYRPSPKIRKCILCGERIKTGEKFCSQKCHKEFLYQKEKERTLKSGEFGAKKYGENMKLVRRILGDIHGYKCSICGISNWNGKNIVLVVDHIDGNADNHRIDNYRLVCPNCNSQLPTFAGRNRGKGRKWRREFRERQKERGEFVF